MAAGLTTVQYGGLIFTNVLTRSWVQEEVRDPSGTDQLCYKHTVRIVGYIHNSTLPSFGVLPVTGSNSAADQRSQIKYLLAARQQFTYTVGAVAVLSVGPAIVPGNLSISGKDVNNGPYAKLMTVDHIAADQIMRVEVEFEVHAVHCDTNGGTGNASGVLSNRWSCTDDINSDFFTVRTFSGRLRVASSQVNPHSFRYVVVPPLQMGLRRESISMRATEDGLWLEYTVVDKEVAFAPPATDWSLRITSRRDLETLFWYTDVDITLKGDRNVDKKKLIAIASAICDAKFSGGVPNAQNFRVESITISDTYNSGENSIDFHATAARLDQNGPAIKGIQAKWLGSPIVAADISSQVNNYDSRISRDGRQGEKLEVGGPIPLAGAFSAYLQTPCSTQHSIAGGSQTQNNSDPTSVTLPTVTATTVTELSDDGSLANYDPTNYSNAYTYWKLDSQYVTTQNRAHCPIAVTGSSSGSQNSSVVVNLAPAMTQRVIRVIAERIGVIPTLPAPVDQFTDENGVTNILLDNNLVGSAPNRSPDNKQNFRVAGEITYALLKPIGASSKLRLGFNSWENQTPTYAMIFPEKSE